MRILFAASEGLPFSKTGGLADVVEALPKALAALNHEVAVVLPRYRATKTSAVVMPSVTIPMGNRLRFPSIADGTTLNGVRYFLVDDPAYFDRDGIYGNAAGDFADNAERFSEFSRAVIEIAKHVWPPDVIHCHDWQTGLVPVLLRSSYADDPLVKNIPVVFTIHNLGYQGLFPAAAMDRASIPREVFQPAGMEFYGILNYLKGGLVYSDYLTTVSKKYAEEIQTVEFGHALDGVVRSRGDHLVGILNGVDYSVWNPEKDQLIAEQYSVKNLSGKAACKKELLEIFGLSPEHLSRPILGIVSRFADQKGFDLIAAAATELMQEDLILTVLGTGERRYEELFESLANEFPGRVGVRIGYDNELAHKIEAGADMFLMPSRYEPCGLNQVYSLKYGTVPIVRATGGLDDTVESFDVEQGSGTGFKFVTYSGAALLDTVRLALHNFVDERIWKRIQLNGMAKDFSWKRPAAEYAKLYKTAQAARNQIPVATSNKGLEERGRPAPVGRAAEDNPMAENIQAVTDGNFEAEVLTASNAQPVMVDFWADWCRPCHMLAPTVAEIAHDYAGKLKVMKLNVDEAINSAGRYNVRGIPTLLVFKNGQVVEQIVGAVPKDQITKALARHVA